MRLRIGPSTGMLAAPAALMSQKAAKQVFCEVLPHYEILQGLPMSHMEAVTPPCDYLEKAFLNTRMGANGSREWEILGDMATRLYYAATNDSGLRKQACTEQIFTSIFATPDECFDFIKRHRRHGAKLIGHHRTEWLSGECDLLEINPHLTSDMFWLRETVTTRIKEGKPPFLVYDPWHFTEMGFRGEEMINFFGPQVALLHGQLRRNDNGKEFRDFCSGNFTWFESSLRLISKISGARDLILEADWWHILGLQSALSQKQVTAASIRFLEKSKEVFGK